MSKGGQPWGKDRDKSYCRSLVSSAASADEVAGKKNWAAALT